LNNFNIKHRDILFGLTDSSSPALGFKIILAFGLQLASPPLFLFALALIFGLTGGFLAAMFFDLAPASLLEKPSLLFLDVRPRLADNGRPAGCFGKPSLVFLPSLPSGDCLASLAQRLTHVGG
jgi:hypothetical protein